MKALQVHAFDAPIQMTNVDIPEPSQGQIRLKIAACGLNFADLLMQKGPIEKMTLWSNKNTIMLVSWNKSLRSR